MARHIPGLDSDGRFFTASIASSAWHEGSHKSELFSPVNDRVFKGRMIYRIHTGSFGGEGDSKKQKWLKLEKDQSEMNDVQGKYPEVIKELSEKYLRWDKETGVTEGNSAYFEDKKKKGDTKRTKSKK